MCRLCPSIEAKTGFRIGPAGKRFDSTVTSMARMTTIDLNQRSAER
jgi:hypothetical protein